MEGYGFGVKETAVVKAIGEGVSMSDHVWVAIGFEDIVEIYMGEFFICCSFCVSQRVSTLLSSIRLLLHPPFLDCSQRRQNAQQKTNLVCLSPYTALPLFQSPSIPLVYPVSATCLAPIVSPRPRSLDLLRSRRLGCL